MARITLEAIFKESGLDKLGRQFDVINQKMRRMADVGKAFGQGDQAQAAFGRQFKVGIEMERSNERLARQKRLAHEILDQMDKANSPERRLSLERRFTVVENAYKKERENQQKLNMGLSEEGKELGKLAILRRGLRLGLAVAGVPTTIAGLAHAGNEAQEQEKLVANMAVRLQDLNRPGRDFTDFTIDLRRNIVAAGAGLAFSGREAINLADSLVQLSGGMGGFKDALEASRGLGISPQQAIQLVGFSRRFGGVGGPGQMSDDKFINLIGRGIADSGMAPRGSEYIQSIIQTMQSYSTRLPSVNPETIASVIRAVNATGIPTLRGQGAMQVTEGITRMMDDQSEAMIALQTELIGRRPDLFSSAAKRYGFSTGLNTSTDRYALALALKQEGLATQDGLRLAGETIKFITGGQDRTTRMVMESMLLRMPIPMVAALEKAGFMDQLREGKISSAEFSKRVSSFQQNAQLMMQTPGMAFARLGRDIAAESVSYVESLIKPFGPYAGAAAEMIEEGRGETAQQKHLADRRRLFTGTAVGLGSMSALAAGLGATTVGAAAAPFAAPLLLAALASYGLGGLSDPRQRKETGAFYTPSVKFQHEVEVLIKLAGGEAMDPMGIGSGIAKVVSQILGQNIKDATKDYGSEVGGMAGAAALSHDKYPSR